MKKNFVYAIKKDIKIIKSRMMAVVKTQISFSKYCN